MTKWILGAVVGGMLLGHFVIPDAIVPHIGTIINVGLCFLLFLVGVDMGRQGTIWQDIKEAGLKVLLIPFAVMLGTFCGAAVASLVLPLGAKDAIAVSAGFGWYSLAPMLLADYSASVSAVAFLANIIREVLAIILVPVIAKRVGYVETVALPGAAAMDTVLPVVVRSTHERITIYSFVSGVILSFAVPVLVPLIISLPF